MKPFFKTYLVSYIKKLFSFSLLFFIYVCEGQRTICGNWFSRFIQGILGIKFRPSNLAASTFTHGAIALTPKRPFPLSFCQFVTFRSWRRSSVTSMHTSETKTAPRSPHVFLLQLHPGNRSSEFLFYFSFQLPLFNVETWLETHTKPHTEESSILRRATLVFQV